VIVVNQAFVRKFFPDGSALGRSIGIGFDGGVLRRIVGVAEDVHDRGVDRNPIATVYIPFRQFALPYGSMVVRTTSDPLGLVQDIRSRVHRVDTAVPLVDFQLLTDRMHAALAEPRFYTYLAALCAGMALVFVMLGVFGIVSFSVARRTSEFGIRMAIGASAGSILAMVLRQSAAMAAAGAAVGLWLALFFGRVLATLPFKVETPRSATLAAGIGGITLVVLAAGYWPARRASRVSPLSALRHE
jgi:predicted lysophospholipase L1 biosynthesis ABC-type transport system permease subunit